KLMDPGPITPNSTRSFRAAEARLYTITDKDSPHLRGKVLVVATPYFATVETSGQKLEHGAFQIADVAEGTYKLCVSYKDGWLDLPEQSVPAPAKRNADVALKIPAGFPLRK